MDVMVIFQTSFLKYVIIK